VLREPATTGEFCFAKWTCVRPASGDGGCWTSQMRATRHRLLRGLSSLAPATGTRRGGRSRSRCGGTSLCAGSSPVRFGPRRDQRLRRRLPSQQRRAGCACRHRSHHLARPAQLRSLYLHLPVCAHISIAILHPQSIIFF
jgi:hypothetical protein